MTTTLFVIGAVLTALACVYVGFVLAIRFIVWLIGIE